MSETLIGVLAAAALGAVGYIYKEFRGMLKSILAEIKAVSLIVRICPGCKEATEQIDDAAEHLKI